MMELPRAKILACLSIFLSCQSAPGGAATAAGETSYVDRLIRPEALEADREDAEEPPDLSGPARSARLEFVKTLLDHNGQRAREDGLLFGFSRESEDYGALSIEGALREGGDGTVTAWQRNLAFDDGWKANNGLGALNTPGIDLARRQYRFFMPSATMEGVSTEWTRGTTAQVVAGVGQPIQFAGIRVPILAHLPGTVFTAGAQTSVAPNWEAGLQMSGANGIERNPGSAPGSVDVKLSTIGIFASAARKDADSRLQANIVVSGTDSDKTRSGVWIDASIRGERVDHNFGFFRLDSNLRLGNQPIANDMQGGYYRAAYQSRRWQWDGGVDYAEPVSGNHRGALFATANGRYQIARDWAVGGGANFQEGLTDAWSAFAFMDNQDVPGMPGTLRTQISHAQDSTRHATRLTLDQSWRVQESLHMSTSLSFARESGEAGSFGNVGLGIYGGGPLGSALTLDANVQRYSKTGADQGPSTFANIAMNWRLAQRWTLSVFVYENDTNGWQPLAVNSPIANPLQTPTQNLRDRGMFLSLRYDFNAGRSYVPLGGAPGEGGGRVSGIVYLDQNDNGRMDAGERGAPNINVILDGRFVTRTDVSGRFDFPQVTAGHHAISILPDNLPLPWKLRNDGQQEFDIKVRSSTTLEIGAYPMR